MGSSTQQTPAAVTAMIEQYDAIIIGAGVSGLYQLYRLRKLGLSVRLYEDGSGVGGTWYWNRYPGCRFDSESETYGYSFSPELLQEWDWKEHYSGQPENERYLNYVADKFYLRRDIQLNSRITSAVYDEREGCWDVQINQRERARARFVIAAVGVLSAHYTPDIPGIESFEGLSLHTGRWPRNRWTLLASAWL
jgi:cation diffusion facilitator CzcD-associated flavoprotein CzcO